MEAYPSRGFLPIPYSLAFIVFKFVENLPPQSRIAVFPLQTPHVGFSTDPTSPFASRFVCDLPFGFGVGHRVKRAFPKYPFGTSCGNPSRCCGTFIECLALCGIFTSPLTPGTFPPLNLWRASSLFIEPSFFCCTVRLPCADLLRKLRSRPAVHCPESLHTEGLLSIF